MRIFLLLFVFALAAPSLSWAESAYVRKKLEAASAEAVKNKDLYYDEVFDRDGKVREVYQDIYPLYLAKTKKALEEIRRLTTQDFSGDNALSVLPRVYDKEEFDEIRDGVKQRGRALYDFLQDYYSGGKSWEKVIPKEVLQRIVARAGEEGYLGKLDPKAIAFMYGPDIIRDVDGVNRVLEDNTGYLGGQGDLIRARESLLRRMPEYKDTMPEESLADPAKFYERLIKQYRGEMANPKDKIVLFSLPPYPDKEDGRLQKIWANLGVQPVTPYSRNPKLIRNKEGTFLEYRNGDVIRREKVGYVIFNGELMAADPSYPAAREQRLTYDAKWELTLKPDDKDFTPLPKPYLKKIEKALEPLPETGKPDFDELERLIYKDAPKEYRNWSWTLGTFKGLSKDLTKGRLATNNTPGLEFVNDKEFNMYVEDLIRHYRKEKPILRNLPAFKLYDVNSDGKRVLNPEAFQKLSENMDKYVVKVVDGRGGEGVWVGPKLSPREKASLLKYLQTNTVRDVIAQEYRHPSVLAGDIVDLRVFAQVGRDGIVNVAKIGWARGVSLLGDGKVNLSAGKAHEVTVLVRKAYGKAYKKAVKALAACAIYYGQIASH